MMQSSNIQTAPHMAMEHDDGPGSFIDPNGPSEIERVEIFMSIVNSLTHILLGGIAFCAFITANFLSVLSSSMSQHIYLNVTGYVIMMGAGILSICPYAGWARFFRYKNRKIVHMCLQGVGSVLVLTGSIIKLTDDINPNFSSTHSILGFTAMLLTITTTLAGIFNCIFNLPRMAKVLHFVCGTLTLIVSFVALIFAFHIYYRVIFNDTASNIFIGITVCALFGILCSVGMNTLRRYF